jgi:hypothetical protein
VKLSSSTIKTHLDLMGVGVGAPSVVLFISVPLCSAALLKKNAIRPASLKCPRKAFADTIVLVAAYAMFASALGHLGFKKSPNRHPGHLQVQGTWSVHG